MIQKAKYVTDEPVTEFIHEIPVEIDGQQHTLVKGMTAKLAPEHGRKWERDYEFRFGEYYRSNNGEKILVLTFHGPVNSKNIRVRRARVHDILRVHDGQRKRRTRKGLTP